MTIMGLLLALIVIFVILYIYQHYAMPNIPSPLNWIGMLIIAGLCILALFGFIGYDFDTGTKIGLADSLPFYA